MELDLNLAWVKPQSIKDCFPLIWAAQSIQKSKLFGKLLCMLCVGPFGWKEIKESLRMLRSHKRRSGLSVRLQLLGGS